MAPSLLCLCHTCIRIQTLIHADEEAAAIGLLRHNMLQSEQIKSLACPGCSLGSHRMDWWGVCPCVWVCLIQIYCYLSGRQADFFAVSRGLNPSLKTVKDYILACFESILQQQTNTPDTRSACRIELMGTYKVKYILLSNREYNKAVFARNFGFWNYIVNLHLCPFSLTHFLYLPKPVQG